MGAKPQPVPPKGVKLEERYGQVGLKAVAAAIKAKPGKEGPGKAGPSKTG